MWVAFIEGKVNHKPARYGIASCSPCSSDDRVGGSPPVCLSYAGGMRADIRAQGDVPADCWLSSRTLASKNGQPPGQIRRSSKYR